MKEIKFRQPLWDEHNKFAGWHYWGFVEDGIFREPAGTPYSSMKEAREQSQQYTGLKDKNGKEIYEGDIYKCDYNDTFDFAYYQVVWDEEKGQWWGECVALHHKNTGYKDISRGGFCESSVASSVNIEIIGNIHEHPHLLEQKNGTV